MTCLVAPRIEALGGLWRRSLFAGPDGALDTTTQVRWLQARAAYADLRQPATRPDFSHVKSLNDLTSKDCARLATQQAFAGHLRFDGRHFEWLRLIDYQPATGVADAGSLEWQGDVLIERGRDVAYIEHWHRDDLAHGAISETRLQEVGTGINAQLLRVGDVFMFARARSLPLSTHRTLGESVSAAGSVAAARERVDCEISFGSVADGDFKIEASTLPFRVGCLLKPHLADGTLTTSDQDSDGATVTRVWNALI